MANRYSRLDNSSPVQQELKSDKKVVPSSAHDLSHIHNGNAIFGALTPVCVIDTVPGQKVDINLSALLEFRNPTTRQLFNSARVYFHARYARLTDLWEGARNWLDNGRSGKLNLTRPNLIYRVYRQISVGDTSVDQNINACTPMSLLNYLGLPPQAMHSHSQFPPLRSFQPAFDFENENTGSLVSDCEVISETPSYFPADLCMMYQRDWRDFYANKNLLQNNSFWFPDNEEHFILSYSAENCVCIKYEDEDLDGVENSQIANICGDYASFESFAYYKENYIDSTPEPNNPSTVPDGVFNPTNYPNLSGLKFVQLRGDRFTTASPFPDLLRGDMPILQLTEDNFVNLYNPRTQSSTYTFDGSAPTSDASNNLKFGVSSSGGASISSSGAASDSYGLSLPNSTVTMSDIYTLETLTAFRKKMGMTNGDYNEMIEAQFGFNPHVHDRHSTYIGGFYQDFAFSSVTQLSESANTPLGTKAGQGVSSGSGSCGQFTAPDFGWIVVYMFILPDVYYTQGKPRMFSKQSNLEMYFPLFNNLPAQGIRNDELYISGDDTIDPQPFAYEDRYAEFKSKQNRVSGFMGLTHSQAEYDSSRVIARRFESLPTFNNNFVHAVPENIDMEVFAVADEPPIDFSIGFNIRSVFPGPYVALEGSLSSPNLN